VKEESHEQRQKAMKRQWSKMQKARNRERRKDNANMPWKRVSSEGRTPRQRDKSRDLEMGTETGGKAESQEQRQAERQKAKYRDRRKGRKLETE
jgi:hypothetical protein